MLGNTISINCEAEGYPIPVITWFKGQGKEVNVKKTLIGIINKFYQRLHKNHVSFGAISKSNHCLEILSIYLKRMSLYLYYTWKWKSH